MMPAPGIRITIHLGCETHGHRQAELGEGQGILIQIAVVVALGNRGHADLPWVNLEKRECTFLADPAYHGLLEHSPEPDIYSDHLRSGTGGRNKRIDHLVRRVAHRDSEVGRMRALPGGTPSAFPG